MADKRQEGKWMNVKNLFALIIGIDDYPHATKLNGAQADADRFASFLQQHLRVSPKRIVNLRNETAKRVNIVEAFRSLWENNFIHRDDPIVIYFAGHGCKIRKPSGWENGGLNEIEGIFSYDIEPEDSISRTIFPIPDRTIAIWLNILSHEKGNNITVIFDCCHSASGARASGPELVRAQEFHGSIPDDIDNESFVIDIPPKFLYQHSRSHVFLAACGSAEYAREVAGRGKFTQELLKTLEREDVDHWSYVEFMKYMRPIAQQTPQCEGHFKNRILFSNFMKIGWGLFRADIVSEYKSSKRTYSINAGSIHGVDNNSIFDLFETAAVDSQTTSPVCRLRAKKVFSLRTTAVMESSVKTAVPDVGFVRLVHPGEPLKVYFSTAFLDVVNESDVIRHAGIDGRIQVVKDASSADFIVDTKDRNVLFTTSLQYVTDHGFSRLPQVVRADPEHVASVLLAKSRWNQHLKVSSPAPWTDNIQIEFFPLKLIHNEMGTATLQRMGESSLNTGNIVFLDVLPDNRDFYGMVLRNGTELDLHVTAVMFDIDSLEIEPYFSGAIGVNISGDADASLPKRKHLTIGYGSSGATPFMFDAPGAGGNVTVLKLYLTTIPLDLGWLKQESPFSDDISRSSKKPNDVQKLTSADPVGATILFTIVQRPQPSS